MFFFFLFSSFFSLFLRYFVSSSLYGFLLFVAGVFCFILSLSVSCVCCGKLALLRSGSFVFQSTLSRMLVGCENDSAFIYVKICTHARTHA